MNAADSLGVGLYSLVEAARLLATPRRTLARWVEGYVLPLQGGEKRYASVIEYEEGAPLSFGDLVELMYVRGFRDGGVTLDEIRETAARFRREWNTPHPLATKRFATDGKRILLKCGGDWAHALTGQRQFFDDLGKQLVHTGDLTSEWRPLGKDRAVVLHPNRAFGKPIEDGCGAHTSVLAAFVTAGDSPEDVAWWYDTTPGGVRDSVEFENRFQPRTHGKVAQAA